MQSRRCVACGQAFAPRPQVPNQAYCPHSECQRERRRRWQRDKLAADPDYRDNQSRAQQAWVQRNPGYWRAYREAHPDYAARNRSQQPSRNARRPPPPIAKMDVSTPLSPFRSGLYRLQPLATPMIAKMDVWIVEIRSHSDTCADPTCGCKEMTC